MRPSGRWGARQKAMVVHAIGECRITFDEACEKYRMSPEELNSWISGFANHGAWGLKASILPKIRKRKISC